MNAKHLIEAMLEAAVTPQRTGATTDVAGDSTHFWLSRHNNLYDAEYSHPDWASANVPGVRDGINVYDDMFAQGWVRLVKEGKVLWYDSGASKPTPKQMMLIKWLALKNGLEPKCESFYINT